MGKSKDGNRVVPGKQIQNREEGKVRVSKIVTFASTSLVYCNIKSIHFLLDLAA